MYTWLVDPENSAYSSPAMLTYPVLKTKQNLLSAFQTLDLSTQTLEKTELANVILQILHFKVKGKGALEFISSCGN